MPPAGKGPLSGDPLHPRAPGGAAPLVPPGSSRTAFLSSAASLGQSAFGRSADGNAICARLSLAWRSIVAIIHTHHAPFSSPCSFPAALARLRAICPAECECARGSRWCGQTRVPLPTPPLRRMRRRQGPASHASTHIAQAVNNRISSRSRPPSRKKHPAPQRGKPPRGDTHPQPEITVEALRDGSSGDNGCAPQRRRG